MNKDTELQVTFEGHVQGIGFRFTTGHYARELGLNGYVRNTTDGHVELIAQGPRPKLEALLRNIHTSVLGRYIFDEFISWTDVTTSLHSFTIRY